KLDTRNLPKPGSGTPTAHRGVVDYADPLQEAIAKVCEEVLDRSPIGPDDNLFDLGLKSLALIKIVTGIEKSTGLQVWVLDVVKAPTIARLAQRGSGTGPPSSLPTCVVPLREGGEGEPLFCVSGAGGGVHWFHDFVKATEWQRPIFGLDTLSLGSSIQ